MRIRIKWQGLDEPLWEKRAIAVRAFQDINISKGEDESTDVRTVEKDITLGNTIVLRKGEIVLKAYYAIVWCACECERLYGGWSTDRRHGRDETAELEPAPITQGAAN
jgi:hypothetical protein